MKIAIYLFPIRLRGLMVSGYGENHHALRR